MLRSARSPLTHVRRANRVDPSPQIHHSTLVGKRASVQQLQARAVELQAQLASYHSLPASALGANMMLQQARERLRAAQERLEAGLADL